MVYIQSLWIMVQKMWTITNEGRPPSQTGSFSLVLISACFGGSFHTGSWTVSLHAEFDQNTMRHSGNVDGIRDCYLERGIRQNLGTDVSNFRLHFCVENDKHFCSILSWPFSLFCGKCLYCSQNKSCEYRSVAKSSSVKVRHFGMYYRVRFVLLQI